MVSETKMNFSLLSSIEEESDMEFNWLEWSPNGRYLAMASNNGGSICLWDQKQSQYYWREVGYFAGVNYVKWSPDSSLFASGCVDGTIRIQKIPEREKDVFIPVEETGTNILGMDWSPDGKSIAISGGRDGVIRFFDPITGIRKEMELKNKSRVNGLCFSPDGLLLAACYEEHGIGVWDLRSGNIVYKYQDQYGFDAEYCITWSPDNATIASCGYNTEVYVKDLRSGDLEITLPFNKNICVDFSSDGKLLAAASMDNRIRIWSIVNWHLMAELEQQIKLRTFGIGGLAFHPLEPVLATHDNGGKLVNIWKYEVI